MMFWFVASMLLAGAMAFVLVPLVQKRRRPISSSRDATNVEIYRAQIRELDADVQSGALSGERRHELVREIEARLLEDTSAAARPVQSRLGSRLAAFALAATAPLLAFGLYLLVGTPAAVSPGMAAASSPHGAESRHVEALVDGLAARLHADPENPNGWIMLARSYVALGRFGEAALAYANATARVKDDAQLFADYADALAMAQGQSLAGEPERLISTALKLDSDNVKARALAGTVAFGKRDYTAALLHWEHIVRVAPQSQFAESVRTSITETRALAAGSPPRESTAAAPAQAGKAPPASRGAAISGVVRLAQADAKTVSPSDTLFVFARAVEGPRMPVAILRAQAKDLPLEFTLDDRSSMVAGVKLSDQQQVVVGARISRSGSATAQPGDPQGYSRPVAPGANGLDIVISAARP